MRKAYDDLCKASVFTLETTRYNRDWHSKTLHRNGQLNEPKLPCRTFHNWYVTEILNRLIFDTNIYLVIYLSCVVKTTWHHGDSITPLSVYSPLVISRVPHGCLKLSSYKSGNIQSGHFKTIATVTILRRHPWQFVYTRDYIKCRVEVLPNPHVYIILMTYIYILQIIIVINKNIVYGLSL